MIWDYEDTDSGNVVYYANYLKYMERGRTEYLRERGIDLADWQGQGLLFAVVEVQVKYHKPARYNDLIILDTELIKHTRATLQFQGSFHTMQNELLAQGTATLACIRAASSRACKIPDEFYRRLVEGA